MASEATTIGEMDGWTITQEAATVLSATKPDRRTCTVGGEDGIDPGVLRQRLFAAMAEADGLAASGTGQVPVAALAVSAGAATGTGQAATIVVHDEKE